MSSITDDIKLAFRSGDTVNRLIIINTVVFLLVTLISIVFEWWIDKTLGMYINSFLLLPSSLPRLLIQPWSIISYGFTHFNFFHYAFNMLGIYAFGVIVSDFINNRRLLAIYLWGVFAGGALFLIMYNTVPFFIAKSGGAALLGASAGVYAIVVAAATISPDYMFHLIFIGPVRIKYIALFYVIMSFAQITGLNAGGELAHMGGALIGYIFVKLLRNGTDLGRPIYAISDFFEALFKPKSKLKVTYSSYKKTSTSTSSAKSSDSVNQAEIDRILDKIAESGYEKLTTEEKQKLFKASQQ